MALNIPMPGDFGDAFSKGLTTGSDVMQRRIMNPYDIRLKEAQAQREDAEAQQSMMLQRMLGQGGEGGGQKMDVNRALMLSGALKLPTHVENGSLITPFGSFPVGETKEQERTAETNKQKELGTYKINEKQQKDVMDSAYVLKNSYNQLKRAKELFEKRPDLTGIIPGLLSKYHLSNDPELAAGIAGFKKMQAGLAKSATARPGIGSINWAEKGKASEFDSTNFNSGKLKEMEDDMREEYDTYRKQYKDATGQNMPSFNEFMNEKEAQEAQQAQQGQAPGQPPQMPVTQQAAPQQPSAPPPQGQPPQAPPPAPGANLVPGLTPDVQKALSMIPPKLSKMAMDAIQQGADPQAVVQEAMKMLNPGMGQQGAR